MHSVIISTNWDLYSKCVITSIRELFIFICFELNYSTTMICWYFSMRKMASSFSVISIANFYENTVWVWVVLVPMRSIQLVFTSKIWMTSITKGSILKNWYAFNVKLHHISHTLMLSNRRKYIQIHQRFAHEREFFL